MLNITKTLFIAFWLVLTSLQLSAQTQQTVGFFKQTTGSQDGYVLFSPNNYNHTYLIDKCGKFVHQWTTTNRPGISSYFMEDGSLLFCGDSVNEFWPFSQGSEGGIIQKYDWNSNLSWSYVLCDSNRTQDHDIYPMPNGNVLALVWNRISANDARAAGRADSLISYNGDLWSTSVVELQPVGNNNAKIVWEWKLSDHFIQDVDSTKPNYGVVADHPELMNINFNGLSLEDWLHTNSVSYNADLDQIMISARNVNEVWVIDHSTTTAEAASHAGGKQGKGGDLLYRWGNPATYNRGTKADQKLFAQHHATWIPKGYKDENKIMIFNDGLYRPAGKISTIEVINQPVDSNGSYTIESGKAFGPAKSYWTYEASNPTDFYSEIMGGAQRLPNGNTLICESTKGNFFEIDTSNNMVWRYVNPVASNGPVAQGTVINSNFVFRSTWYPTDYAGFKNQTLTATAPIEVNPLTYDCFSTTTGLYDVQAGFIPVNVNNPFTDLLVLYPNEDMANASITLTDITGKEVQRWDNVNIAKNTDMQLSIGIEKSGVYILKIHNAGSSFTTKLIHN